MSEKIRVDKWLWAVRIYKSRTASTDACKAGKISIGNSEIKPSYLVQSGQVLEVRKNGFCILFKVIKPISKRVSAPEAILAYENQTSEEELQKFNSFYIGKNKAEIRDKGTGRPTKKERRELDEYKLDFFDWDDI